MFGGLNLLQSSALAMASQPSFPQTTRIFDIDVPEGPNDVPLKFKQLGMGGMMSMGGMAGGPMALPMFLPGTSPGETVINSATYYNPLPPRNCIEAVCRWLCPGRVPGSMRSSTASVDASGMGCFCCPGYRFCKCCDVRLPSNSVPITISNPLNIEDVQQQVEIEETRPMLPFQIMDNASRAVQTTTRSIMPMGPIGVPMPMMMGGSAQMTLQGSLAGSIIGMQGGPPVGMAAGLAGLFSGPGGPGMGPPIGMGMPGQGQAPSNPMMISHPMGGIGA